MVQIFGNVERSTVQNGQEIVTFRIPAFSKTLARQRGKANARIKGMSDYSISTVEEVGSTDIPGQSFYDVTVVSG